MHVRKDYSSLYSQNKRPVKLQYGIRNGNLVHISEIPESKRGLKCNCICPGCGGQLLARLGPVNQHSFAHKAAECNISGAQQTALHMLAKELIDENKTLVFPSIEINQDAYVSDIDDDRIRLKIPPSLTYMKARRVKCDTVSLEKRVSDIIPDVVISARGHICLIEIAVTHYIDKEKEKRIKKIGLPLFEISLRQFRHADFSKVNLSEEILNNPENRKWIYNPVYIKAGEWAKDEYAKIIQEAAEEVARENAESDRKKQIEIEKAIEERRQKTRSEITIGFEDVRDQDYDSNNPIYDRFKQRWVKCSRCGQLFRQDQMVYYGWGGVNKGVCRGCFEITNQ